MKIHFLHSSSASNRANSKVSQRIAPLQVVIVAVFKIRRIFVIGQNGGMLKTVNSAFDEYLPVRALT